MNRTQDHISILDIQNDTILLKSGEAALVLKTGAVNFGLLSDEEQVAIIGSFAQMLNSLSFPIQIVIRSNRLDITSYLKLLDNALKLQPNLLLAELMVRYRSFVQSLIKENEVLDKSFYIVIPLSALEIGITVKVKADKLKKAQTTLLPRRDQIIRQLARVGLSAVSLNTQELIKLFYDIYNPPTNLPQVAPISVNLNTPTVAKPPVSYVPPPVPPPVPLTASPKPRNHPFVVEELMDTA